MTDKEQNENPEEAVELTVEDILETPQSPDAQEANASETAAPASAEGEVADEATSLLADLQRLNAEYANYRKRMDAERQLLTKLSNDALIRELLPILDDIDRARAADDIAAGSAIAVIVEKFEGVLSGTELEKFAAAGEVFDPNLHEAVAQIPVPGATAELIIEVVLPGYRRGERLLRAAKVVVSQIDGS